MTPIVLLLSLFALILTKVADIVTTVRGLRCSGSAPLEQNPLARWAMLRWGMGGITAVMLLWGLLVALTFIPAWHSPGEIQLGVVAMGFLIAWFLWDVARFNATRRHSWFTRLMMRAYGWWRNRTVRR